MKQPKSVFIRGVRATVKLTMLVGLVHTNVALAASGTNKSPVPDVVSPSDLLLHVPSPDWRDQIIYFVMIDRFSDGRKLNNDLGVGVFDPNKKSHYSGGDLEGIRQQLDYIQSLGATTLWITPPVANQWWDPLVNYGGYHGYWARDFSAVDEHYGSLLDYQRLSDALHRRGMFLMQDIVVNHVGNYFNFPVSSIQDADKTTDQVEHGPSRNLESIPTTTPTQFPYSLSNPLNAAHLEQDVYNWTPKISDVTDRVQELTYQLSGLDDLNTRSVLVRDKLKEDYGNWIKNVGVDSFRIDTAKYVEPEFYDSFMNDDDGILESARVTGRHNFFTIGEIFLTSEPLDNTAELAMQPYLDSDNLSRIDAPLGFPLYKEMERVYAKGKPTSFLSYRIEHQMKSFHRPLLVANFLDNHDVERFLTRGDIAAFKQANVLLFTAPGIPVVYQGDEQGFTQTRKAMFAGGYESKQDHFDHSSDLFKFISSLAKLRKDYAVFRRGGWQQEADTRLGAGIFAFSRRHENKIAYVIQNTASHAVLLDNRIASVRKMNTLDVVFTDGLSEGPSNALTEETSKAESLAKAALDSRVLPPKSTIVLHGTVGSNVSAAVDENQLFVSSIKDKYINATIATIEGSSALASIELKGVLDGNYDEAQTIKVDDSGQWSFTLDVDNLGSRKRSLVVFDPRTKSSTDIHHFVTQFDQATLSSDVEDPSKDNSGPSGNYLNPLNESHGCQSDIEKVSAKAHKSGLVLDITMCEITSYWSPPNGFDHVSFNIFFTIPNASNPAIGDLPGLQAKHVSDGWNIAHELYGWNNTMYSSQGADLNEIGARFGYAPSVKVDKEKKRIQIQYDGEAFGVADWSNVEVYLTTWDRDGGDGQYRPLAKDTGQWNFGGAVSSDPYILDDIFFRMNNER